MQPPRLVTRCANCNSKGPHYTCSGCLGVLYCDSLCQRDDWQCHKLSCFERIACQEIKHLGPAHGINIRLDKWIKFYKNTLLVSSIHALPLPTRLSRAPGKVLRILLVPQAGEEEPKKYFRVCVAWTTELEELVNLGGQWAAAVQLLRQLYESGASRRTSASTTVFLECPAFGIRILQLRSLKKLKKVDVQQNWEALLIDAVRRGERVVGWDFGNAK